MYQLGSGLRVRRLAERLVRLSGYGKTGLLSVVTGVSLVAFSALNGYAPGLLDGKSMTTAGYVQPRASATIDPARLDPADTDPSNSDQSDTVLVTTSSWMVQTDDFLDSLRSESFWKKRSGAKRSRASRVKNSRGNNGSASGNPFWYSGNDGLTNEGPKTRRNVRNEDRWDAKVQQDVASQFYSGGGNTYRTLCVRICDGSFRPVSFSTTKSNFRRDERKCKKRNGREAKLYVYRNPGQKIEDMADLRGRKYVKSTTAFLFRTVYNPSCKSKPHPWQIAALDRHKLYRMKADMRKLRGKTRRLAKLELRRFKGTMKNRQLDEARMIALARNDLSLRQNALSGRQAGNDQTNIVAAGTGAATGTRLQVVANHILTSVTHADLAKWRITTLSPIRALLTRPQETALRAASLQANLIIVPENDDSPIYLPVRLASQGAAIVASRNSTAQPHAGTQSSQIKVTATHKLAALSTNTPSAPLEATAITSSFPSSSSSPLASSPLRRLATNVIAGSAGGTAISSDLAAIIVPDNDTSPIFLPTRNMFRGLSSIAAITSSDLEPDLEQGSDANKRARTQRLAKAHRGSRMSLGARKALSRKTAKAEKKPKAIARRPAPKKRRKKWRSNIFSSER